MADEMKPKTPVLKIKDLERRKCSPFPVIFTNHCDGRKFRNDVQLRFSRIAEEPEGTAIHEQCDVVMAIGSATELRDMLTKLLEP